MKKVDRLSPTKVRLRLEFSQENVRDHEVMIANKYVAQARIPGFRPGKAPLKMVRERYKDEIVRELIQHLVEAGLHEAIEQTKLMPVNQPKIKLEALTDSKPFGFEAEFEVEPQIELKKYKDIPLKSVKTEVDKKEVEDAIMNLRERLASLDPSDSQTLEKGSFGVVDVAFKTIDGSKSEDAKTYTVEVGAGKLLPELDKGLVGMKIGETKEIDEMFPEEYSDKAVAGKKATFTCKLIEVKKKNLPEADDAFANQIREGWTIANLREDIEKNLRQQKDEETQSAQRQEMLDYLVKYNEFEAPSSMVDERAQQLIQSVQEDMKRRGMNPPPIKPEEMKTVRERAERVVRGSLLLKEIAAKENIALDEQRLNARIDAIAGQLNRSVDETKKFLSGKGLLNRLSHEILTDQVFEFLKDKAKIG